MIIDISSSEKIIEILQNKNIQLSLYQSGDVSDLMNSIKDKELEKMAKKMIKSGYGKYLLDILNDPLRDNFKNF